VLIHLFDPHLSYDPKAGYRTKFTAGRFRPPLPLTHDCCLSMQTNNGKDPPLPADIQYIKGVYYGEISFVDEQIGRLVGELKALGIYDNTTLVVTADHGEEFWDHGGFEHGHTLYDELLRVPLIIKFPARLRPIKRVVNAQVRVLDVMPTVFDLLGIKQPETFVGESLIPLVMGKTSEDRFTFGESTLYGEDKLCWRNADYTYIRTDPDSPAQQVEELYDRRRDPTERANLVNEQTETAAALRAELLEFYDQLLDHVRAVPMPDAVNMSPDRIQQLRSLGYLR
jgi:arylsulfatase A-like enzyme